MRSLAEDDDVFCGDTSIDEVSAFAVCFIIKIVYGILDRDEADPTCIVSEVCISFEF